ncbi:MAG: TIGR03084 family protein [Acidimicrobiia bacterium]|nr:TIGR03084 family protein [Acidimicrobiia bacterium]
MGAVEQICEDLAAEHAALDAVVADLDETGWATPTPAAGWDVKDTILHIHAADGMALLAVKDPAAFEDAKVALLGGASLDGWFVDAATTSGAEVLARWRADREGMLAAFRPLGPKDRVPWFGPSMSALSFATARLMETWAHGHDVATALGRELPVTDRLRHVCHIGVTTRGWSYVNRGETVPEGDVRLELVAPSGQTWTWGPDGAGSTVSGTALEFALVATQRRHLSDTALLVEGELARDWLDRAQAFAGAATNTDPAREGLTVG